MSAGSFGSMPVTSWNSSNESATRRLRSAAILAGSSSSDSIVASMSSGGRAIDPPKLKLYDPSAGLTVTVGAMRTLAIRSSASFAFISGEASS